MQLAPDFTVRATPTTPESRKATADAIEAFIGAIFTGQSKPDAIDTRLLAAAVQGLRDTAARPPAGRTVIVVDVKNEILGDSMFWRGPPERIGDIRNIPARETAKLVVKDGKARQHGMWHVRAEAQPDDLAEQAARMAFLAEHWHSSLDGVRTRDFLADSGNIMRHGGFIAALDYLRSQAGAGAAA